MKRLTNDKTAKPEASVKIWCVGYNMLSGPTGTLMRAVRLPLTEAQREW